MDSIIKVLYMTLQCHQSPPLLTFPLFLASVLHSSSGLSHELGLASWGEAVLSLGALISFAAHAAELEHLYILPCCHRGPL